MARVPTRTFPISAALLIAAGIVLIAALPSADASRKTIVAPGPGARGLTAAVHRGVGHALVEAVTRGSPTSGDPDEHSGPRRARPRIEDLRDGSDRSCQRPDDPGPCRIYPPTETPSNFHDRRAPLGGVSPVFVLLRTIVLLC